MKLYKFSGKRVKLITKDGDVYTGMAYDYIPAQDNPDNVACITVNDFEFSETEIESITFIEDHE